MEFGLCKTVATKNHICLADTAIRIGWPLIAAGEVFALIGVILLFANASGLRAWLKMSAVFVPLAILGVVFFPVLSPLGLIAPTTPDYQFAVRLFGFAYLILSLGAVLRGRVIVHKKIL